MPFVVPAVLIALGAAITLWFTSDNDPGWSDKTVFNDRMRQIQSGMLDTNTALSKCQAFMADSVSLTAWRNFVKNWSAYYASVGRLDYFDPSSSVVANGKIYASQLAKWIDYMKTIEDCARLVPKVPSQANIPAPQSPPSASLPSWAWQLGGLVVGGGIIAVILNKKL